MTEAIASGQVAKPDLLQTGLQPNTPCAATYTCGPGCELFYNLERWSGVICGRSRDCIVIRFLQTL